MFHKFDCISSANYKVKGLHIPVLDYWKIPTGLATTKVSTTQLISMLYQFCYNITPTYFILI